MSKKAKKIKAPKYETSESEEIKRFIIILVVIVLFIVGVYFFTKIVIKKIDVFKHDETTGVVDKDKVIVGTMFNRPENEYYVAIYNGEKSEAVEISTLVNKYMEKEEHLRIYFCDLNNELNKSYIANEEKPVNIKAKNIKDVSFGSITLVKINKGAITEYYEGIEKISKVLN